MNKMLERRVRRVLGDGLPEDVVQEALVLVYDDLTRAVGRWLTDPRTLAEIRAFEELESRDEAAAGAWLTEHLPGLRQFVESETVAVLTRLEQIRG